MRPAGVLRYDGETMTGRDRILALLEGKAVDRPPFVPAVYEHKAALIGQTPSEIGRSEALLEKALFREHEIYGADILTVGVDVYNVEAEAAGARVRLSSANDVPSIESRPLRPGEEVRGRKIPEPEKDGRMPVFLEAGRRVQSELGRTTIVRGALSAPFSLACGLVEPADVLTALLDRPEWTASLLDYCAEIVKAYGRAFVRRGLGIVLFDSHASPPLVSPGLYQKIVLPPTARVIDYFRRDLGVPLVPYIVGGDTALLLESLLASGTNALLCDFKADLRFFVERLKTTDILLRANLDPGFLFQASIPEIETRTRALLAAGRAYPRFLLGTGILPYDLPPEKALAVRRALEEAAHR